MNADSQQLAFWERSLSLPDEEDLVYYAWLDGGIKIGHGNVDARMAVYRTSSIRVDLLATESGGLEIEQLRHRQFARFRLNSRQELFAPAPSLLLAIEMIRDQRSGAIMPMRRPL
jgi:hypothetical protein